MSSTNSKHPHKNKTEEEVELEDAEEMYPCCIGGSCRIWFSSAQYWKEEMDEELGE